jgi:RND family efflux transporter MFP subunit
MSGVGRGAMIRGRSAMTGAARARMRFSQMMYIRGLVVLAILFALGIVPRIVSRASTRKNDNEASAKIRVIHPLPARRELLALPSTMQANHQVNINARQAGYVLHRYVDIGTKVTKGQVLAIVAAPEVEQQTKQARSDIRRTEAGVVQARAGVQQAVANLSASQAGISEARARQLQSVANLATARARQTQTVETLKARKAAQAAALSQNDLATKTNDRWIRLLADGAVPPQDADQKRVDYETARANLKSAIANVYEAHAEYAAAAAQIKASEADLGATSAALNAAVQNAEAARANVRANQANTEANRANVVSSVANATRAQILQNYTRVVAPYNGIITGRNIDVGSLVDTPTVLFTMASNDRLRVQVRAPEANLPDIHLNQVVNMTVLERPDQIFNATVTRFSGGLDEQSHTLLIEMVIENDKGLLYPGMYATVNFDLPSDRSILIPSTALMVNADGIQVQTVKDSKIHNQKIQIGRDLGPEIEVTKGLKVDDTVVLIPSVGYSQTDKVETEFAPATPTPTATPATETPSASQRAATGKPAVGTPGSESDPIRTRQP